MENVRKRMKTISKTNVLVSWKLHGTKQPVRFSRTKAAEGDLLFQIFELKRNVKRFSFIISRPTFQTEIIKEYKRRTRAAIIFVIFVIFSENFAARGEKEVARVKINSNEMMKIRSLSLFRRNRERPNIFAPAKHD